MNGKVEFGRNFSSAKREEKLRPPQSIQYIKAMKIRRIFQEKKFHDFRKSYMQIGPCVVLKNWLENFPSIEGIQYIY